LGVSKKTSIKLTNTEKDYMKKPLLYTPFLIFVILVVLAGCNSETLQPTIIPSPSDTPMNIPTPSITQETLTDELTFIAPTGNAAIIDGRIMPDEWGEAARVKLAYGELLLMQDGDYLYVGISSDYLGLGSVCIYLDEKISVLHSSAALGTATYAENDGSWQKTGDFVWSNRETSMSQSAQQARQRHLETNNWVASNGNMGERGEMEYQIAMTDGAVRLAVTYLMSPEYTTTDFWPETLADGCRYFEPLPGDAPEIVNFAPETWMRVIAPDE
jgi:hypothetical protein